MKRPQIKICGITNYEDAELCLSYGADMLGFIFYGPSPRHIDPEQAGNIIQKLKDQFDFIPIGVFVNSSYESITDTIQKSGVHTIQFHGDEPWSFVKSFKEPKIKAFRIKDRIDLSQCEKYLDVNFFLLDTFSKKIYGGTGKSFDWNFLDGFRHKERLILSGGLDSNNIIQAIESISPYAVDLSSSLEDKPGKKDKSKVKNFFSTLKKI